jgi:hypothetical protein
MLDEGMHGRDDRRHDAPCLSLASGSGTPMMLVSAAMQAVIAEAQASPRHASQRASEPALSE